MSSPVLMGNNVQAILSYLYAYKYPSAIEPEQQ